MGCCSILFSQTNISPDWVKTYDDNGPGWAYSAICFKNSYYVAGNLSPRGGVRVAFIMKCNENGEKIWLNQYEFPGYNSWGKELKPSKDGKNISLRCRLEPTKGNDKIGFIKIDEDGNKIAEKIIDKENAFPCLDTNSLIVFEGDSIIKIENNKEIMSGSLSDWGIFTKDYKSVWISSIYPFGSSLILIANSKLDSMYANVKYVGAFYGFKIMSIDCNLRMYWEVSHKNIDARDYISSVYEDKEYNVAITGRKNSCVLFEVIDATGTELIYNSLSAGHGEQIISNEKGKYVIAGQSNNSFFVTCVNKKGATVWSSSPIKSEFESGATSVCFSESNAILACGYISRGGDNSASDFMIAKYSFKKKTQ
jgi:hypothetical protein